MQEVTVYTTPMCAFCFRALALLKKRGAKVTEISAAFSRQKREEMLAKSNGMYTYPQIFIGDLHIGGSDELAALENAGELDALLNG